MQLSDCIPVLNKMVQWYKNVGLCNIRNRSGQNLCLRLEVNPVELVTAPRASRSEELLNYGPFRFMECAEENTFARCLVNLMLGTINAKMP